VILALAAFAAIVLAEPQFGIRRPFPTLPRVTPGRPTPVPRPFRNPGVPPRRPIPPRRGGISGRFGRQLDFSTILTSIQSAPKTVSGIPFPIPDITNLTRNG
jgi:hypothetical protein